MAENSLLRIAPARPTPTLRRAKHQQRRRNLRIAIRQLERAELYLVALYSLDIGDERAEAAIDHMIRDVRGLRDHLTRARVSTAF